MTAPVVDVYVGAEGLDTVTCTSSRLQGHTGANLQLDRVSLRDLPDDTLQQIADAIELYLIKKNQRERKAKAAAQGPAPAKEGAPE